MLRNARRALPKAISGRTPGRLRRALDELAVTIERTATIVAQTRSRLAGLIPDSATRLVSLHDPDARPIRKGRIDKPVEFGYKAQVVDNDDGVILDHSVEFGAAPTGRSWRPRSNGSQARRPRAPRGHRRPRLRPGRGRTRPARTRRAHRRDSPPGQDPRRPQGHRAQPRASATRQMADRIRRHGSTTSNAATAGTAPTGRHRRSPNLVRTRRLRPQPRQDRRPRQLTGPKASRTTITSDGQPRITPEAFSGRSS